MDVVVEGAKCEELEKIVIDDDKEKFFQVEVFPSRSAIISSGEGRIGCLP